MTSNGEGAAAGERGSVAVIGAGIVGLSCALYLARDGWRVTLFDPDEPGSSSFTSYGNAGAISSQSVVPMAGPGVIKQVPKWLLDPLGPLAIRWSYLPRLAPWLARFVAAGTPQRIAEQSAALAALHRPVLDAHRELAADAEASELIHQNGSLMLYETEAAFQGDARSRALIRSHGHTVEEIGPDEIRQLEPALAPIFVRGTWYPNGGHCVNPGDLCRRLAAALRRRGGEIVHERVTGFEIGGDGPTAVRTEAGSRPTERVVIAAGAWSHRLAAMFGDKCPLESERGYHMILPDSGVETRRPVSFNERRFMTTTMQTGLRLAGTVEFAGLEAPPTWGRAEKLLTHAREVFRDVNVEGGQRWMGQRPATPDSLPVIGRSPRHRNVFYAFGHGHLGLTGGPITGRQIAALVAGRDPEIDLTPFRIDRF